MVALDQEGVAFEQIALLLCSDVRFVPKADSCTAVKNVVMITSIGCAFAAASLLR
jgi:hypothetical protein